ncbi:charged multivesicular body protein 1a-like [Felis catus]|uniref:charged multivesicular body protein 1a-like n=1 Tax=Felis catus TaxID=9685 RepID=UPI001D19AB70|nr:charged multivesicular body protein 1a-like [Felis catus]
MASNKLPLDILISHIKRRPLSGSVNLPPIIFWKGFIVIFPFWHYTSSAPQSQTAPTPPYPAGFARKQEVGLRIWELGEQQAIQRGNIEVARIHAEDAILQRNQAINFLRMSARVDAVAARVQIAVTMGKVTKSMAGVVKSIDGTLRSMNLEKISALMDKFEHQFETLYVQTQQMEDTMSSTRTKWLCCFKKWQMKLDSYLCTRSSKLYPQQHSLPHAYF